MIKLRFLLLEDDAVRAEYNPDATDAQLIQLTLTRGKIDCDLIQVSSRAALITALEQETVDLILATDQVPGLTSIEALEILQNRGLDVPFILLTESEATAIERLQQGATDYVLIHHLDGLVPVVYRALREGQKRRELQAALNESQAQLQSVVANIPGMLFRYATGLAHFTFVSSCCRDLFEIEPEAALQDATAIWNLIHPDDVAAFQQGIDYSVSNFLPWEWLGRIITPSGQLKWLHGQSKVVQTEDGVVWDGWLLDISDRKTIEEALRQSELKFRMMVESAKDYAIFTVDLSNSITSWNAGAQNLLHYTESEILGQKGDIIYTLEDRANRKPEAEIHATLTKGRAENERWHVRKDGSRFWGSGLMMSLHDQAGQIQGFLKIMQDKTEQRQTQEALRYQAEELTRANRIKDEFLAVLSHELRTPLNPILGWIKLLKSGRVDATRMQQAIDIIDRNAQLQTQLIEDLLDVSRILQGKLKLNASRIDLCTVVSAAIDTVRLAANAKSIDIQYERPEARLQIVGDATRLQQVVWNLLSNAVKFTPTRGQIQVRVEPRDNTAQIQVIDTGIGINPKFLPYVFEYFRQEDSSTTRRFGGLGLGLAIVRQIVELHGGSVFVESEGEEQGATFTVRLPLQTNQPQIDDATAATAQAQPQQPLGGIRAFVVDDEPDSRDFVAFVLEQAGAEVKTAASGLEAFSVFAQFAPDILLSDIGMPDMDGYMLIQQIRQSSNIPAIALTAYAGEVDQKTAIEAGFQQHLSKPLDPDRLLSVVIELVQLS
jgi:PAS domain S-box-containing protein